MIKKINYFFLVQIVFFKENSFFSSIACRITWFVDSISINGLIAVAPGLMLRHVDGDRQGTGKRHVDGDRQGTGKFLAKMGLDTGIGKK